MRNIPSALPRREEYSDGMTNTYFRTVTTAYAKMYLAARVEFLARRAIRIARETK